MILTSDYDYSLPADRIAQEPVSPRDGSLMLVLNRFDGSLEDKMFSQLEQYLNPGDLLVLNDTKVIPARLFARKETGAKIEVFLLEELSINTWSVMVRPAKRVKVDDILIFDVYVKASVTEHQGKGLRVLRFEGSNAIRESLLNLGKMPLPPYIHYDESKAKQYVEQYQTVFAAHEGAVAAPTAGLHFTQALLNRLAEKGVKQTTVTLHVGLGTFKPVETEDMTKHPIHSERYCLSEEAIDLIKETKQQGGRIIAVGTTVVRVLEGVFAKQGDLIAGSGLVNVFIYPGFSFHIVDALVTNFHLPKSSLLALVSAFADHKAIMNAYRHAIEAKYRFFSFGDAMLII